MLKLRINPKAVEDLKSIRDYISNELENPVAAKDTINDIIEAYEKLLYFPCMGRKLSSKISIQTDYRYLVCNQYIVFYKCNEEHVSIYRILSSKRDYLHILLIEDNKLH